MTMYDKIARMKPEQENHWFDLPELSCWGERFFAEFAVAEALAAPEEQPVLEQAIDTLYDSFTREHALTDSACRQAEAVLLPFGNRAKQYTIHCVAHAHIDMDWMWGFHETVDVILSTVRTMLDLMEEYPDFTFSQSQCAVYRIVETYDPPLFRRLKKRIQEGRWEFAGSAYVELDKNLPNLESMARHILYTKQYLNQAFGIPYETVNLDFHPDSFGHSASVPEILRAGGIRYFYHCRGLDGQYLYRWRGPSGAEVLALNEPLWYNDPIRPMYLSQAPKFCDRYGIHDMMKIYGVGDHGGGPTRQDLERIRDMQTWPVAPTIRFSTYGQYFDAVAPYKDAFPVVAGELGPTFTGCYTSQSRTKQANRVAEDRLFLAEGLNAFAVRYTGMDDYNPQLRMAWEKVLFNQFHDILPGSNTPESREHALGGFEDAMGAVMSASGAALRSFADAIDTSQYETPFAPLSSRSEGGGVGRNTDVRHRFRLPGAERGRGKTRLLHFFNPTNFDRRDVQDVTLWDWEGNPAQLAAWDESGNPLPCQAVGKPALDWSHTRTEVQVKVCVPALSYVTVALTEAPKTGFAFCELPPDPRVTCYPPLALENETVRVEFDEEDLSVKCYVNKRTGESLLGADGGRFILYRERNVPKGGCGWVEGVHQSPVDLHRAGTPVLKEAAHRSGLGQELRYELRYGQSVIAVRARLDDGSGVLELETVCDWRETAQETGSPKLSFRADLSWTPERYLSDSQIGLDVRKPEAMHDWWGRDFTCACGKTGGFALLTDCKYGYRGYGSRLEVSLLRSSSRPDPLPEVGERTFRIGLASAPADALALKELGSAFVHRDLPYASNYAHGGTLPLSGALLTLSGPAALSAVKVPEDGDGLILRLVAVNGAPAAVAVGLPGLTEAWYTDLAEQPLAPCPVCGSRAEVAIGGNQVVTVRLK